MSDDVVNRSPTYVLHEWANLNFHGPTASSKRFQKNEFLIRISKFFNKLPFFGSKEDEYTLIRNPEHIFPHDYLGTSESPVSPREKSATVQWTRCEWRHVKGVLYL